MKFNLTIALIIFVSSIHAQQSWQEHTLQADSLELQFKFEKSLLAREKAISTISRSEKDTLIFLKTLKEIAQQEVWISNPEKQKQSYKTLKKKINKLEKLGAKPERMYQTYRRLYIFAHNYMRDMEETNIYIEKSINAHLKCKKIDSLVLLKTMHSMGVVSRELGMFKKAINTFSKAEEFYNSQKVKDTNMLGSIYLDLANTYNSHFLNQPQKRINYLKKAESVFTNLNKPNMDYLVAVYPMMADVEKENGDYQEAINYLNKGLALYENDKEASQKMRMGKIGYKRVLQFHHFLVEIYSKKEDEEKMLSHLNTMKSITSGKKLDAIETDFISLAYLFISRYYRNAKEYDKAMNYIDKGLKLNKKIHEEYLEPDFLLEKAKVLTATKKYSKAETLLNKVEKISNNPSFIIKDLLVTKTLLFIEQDQRENTFNAINKSLKWLSQDPSKINISTSTYEDFIPSPVLKDANLILKIAKKLKESSIAANKETKMLYWFALKQFKENFENQLLNQESNKVFSKINAYFFDLASKKELTKEEEGRFFSFLETVQAKYLFKSFIENQNLVFTPQLDSLMLKEKFLRSNITYLKQKLLTQKQDSIKIRQQLFEENRTLTAIISKKNSFDDGYIQLLNEKAYTSNLNYFKNDYILKYKEADGNLYRILFYKQKIEVTNLGTLETSKALVLEYVSMLKDRTVPVAQIKEKGALLYSFLFKNLSNKNIPKVYIIPDGVLNNLPFDLLVKKNDYLIQTTEVSYAAAISLLKDPSEKNNKPFNKIALFAPSYGMYKPDKNQLALRGEPHYLQGALKEVDLIASIFESKLFKKEAATKASFINLKEDYSIIHLSMHSFLNDDDAELSSLVFTDEVSDYKLYISELYGLHFNTDLVVLSACNTGIGNFKTGRGIISMQTAFTAAGVPSVLSSLWSAPDQATQKIMVSFYKNLKKGLPKSKVLQLAKLEYLNTTQEQSLKHPFYWAGFVLSGDTSPIRNSTPYGTKIWLVSGVLLLGLVGLGLYFRKKKQRQAA